jgi:hypothetical protein
MKATIEVPDDLYRQVKAKSALEGRPLREVAIELFRQYVTPGPARPKAAQGEKPKFPSWFGRLGAASETQVDHDLETIRRSIAAGIVKERQL